MNSKKTPYSTSLNSFVSKYKRHICEAYSVDPEDFHDSEIRNALQYSIGIKLKEIFDRDSKLGLEVFKLILEIPSEKRNSKSIVKAECALDVLSITNCSLQNVKVDKEPHGKVISVALEEFRRSRRNMAFRKLASSSVQIALSISSVISCLRKHKQENSFESRTKVKIASKALKSALMDSHRQTRLAAAWAVREGYGGTMITKALHRLYIKPMKALEIRLKALDDLMDKRGFDCKICDGITRRRHVIARELMMVHASPSHQEEVAAVDVAMISKGFSHGAVNSYGLRA